MITVFVDPWTRRVIEVLDPRRFGIGERILAWQHALHAGEALGWAWKILVFLSGFLPPLFVVTGVTMWWRKRSRRSRRSPPRISFSIRSTRLGGPGNEEFLHKNLGGGVRVSRPCR